jgi:RNase P subunit RPR2
MSSQRWKVNFALWRGEEWYRTLCADCVQELSREGNTASEVRPGGEHTSRCSRCGAGQRKLPPQGQSRRSRKKMTEQEVERADPAIAAWLDECGV